MDRPILKLALRCPFAIALLLLSGRARAETKQEIGERLLETAQKLSDIRAEGAPAFRMEAKFRIKSKSQAKDIDGKYSEIWVSKAKWHREVETPFFHRLEVGLSASSSAYLDSGSDRLDKFSDRMLLRFPKSASEIKGVSSREVAGVKASCVESKVVNAKNVDCVDLATGAFLSREIDRGSGPETCWYRDYHAFGGRSFPRSVHCEKKHGDDTEMTISSLAAGTSTDESLFAKPPGAVEVADMNGCRGHPATPPQVTYDPEPKYPEHGEDGVTVVISTVVGVDGTPQDPYVTNRVRKDFDQAALDAVRQWRFKPAVCDGEPVPVVISVQINFRNH